MDMSNSLVTTGFQPKTLITTNQADRQPRLPVPDPKTNEDKNSLINDQSRNDRSRVNQVEYVKKGEAVQAERFQRLNSLESAPFKGQQAINSYQKTIEAAKQYEEGELVGVDLYV